jgi:O-antigen/teichoic acid export membrane protein
MRLKKLILQNIFWRGLYFFSVFVLNILIARYFKASGSGWIYYLINNLSFLLLIAGASLESGAGYYSAKHETSSLKVAQVCLVWAIIASVISGFFLFLFPHFFLDSDIANKEYFFSCIAYVFGTLLISYFSALFFAKQHFFISNFILFFSNLSMICVILLSAGNSFFSAHFVTIYFSFFLLQGIVIMIIYFLRYQYLQKSVLQLTELKKIWSYSLLALCANITFFLVYRVDYWFVKQFCSEKDLGNYIQVSKIGQIFLLIPIMIAAIIFPRTAGESDINIQASLKFLSRVLFSFYFFFVIILSVCGKWFFPLIYGYSFDNMYEPFLLLSPGILSLSIQTLLAAYFAGRDKVNVNFFGALLSLIIIISGNAWLTPMYGIKAASAISSVGYICYLIFSLIVFNKNNNGKTSEFFILKKSDVSDTIHFFGKKDI